jgi:excisionase family DNA binding protein
MREDDGLAVPPEWLDKIADLVAEKLGNRSEPPTQWPQWMSIETAARYLDCPPERLHKLKQRHQIPHAQDGPGGRIWFEREALDQWMRKRSDPPPPTGSADVVG